MRKPKIRTLFIFGLAVILILLSIAYTIESLTQVRELGDYAVKIDKDNSQTIASDLFLKLTEKTARNFSLCFGLTSSAIQVLADDVLNEMLNKETSKDQIYLKPYKSRDFLVDTTKKDCSVYYWGKQDKPSQKVMTQLNNVYSLSPTFKKLYDFNSRFYTCLWVIGADGFTFTYPSSKNDYENVRHKSTFVKAFADDSFPLRSKIPDSVTSTYYYANAKPYRAVSGKLVICTESAIYDKNNNLIAWIGVDFNVKSIIEALTEGSYFQKSIILGDVKTDSMKGFLFILTKDETIIAFPKEYNELFKLPKVNLSANELYTVAKIKLSESKNANILQLAKLINNYNTGIDKVILNNESYVIAFAGIKSTGWTLCYAIKEDSLLHSALKTKEKMETTESRMKKNFIWISLIFIAISFILLSIFFSHFIAKPIRHIASGIKKMGKGDFDINLKEEGAAEIAQLSNAFNFLGKELKSYMENFSHEVEARQSVETEIRIAADMQKSILPDKTSIPCSNEFTIFAQLNPVKEVSGDFYDYFNVDENRIAVLIADVSGKGLPAAFFMSMSKVLIKNYCAMEDDPGKVLERANKSLCVDNKAQMFVTVFLAFYNKKTGTFIYANGGHHPGIKISEKNVEYFGGNINNIALGILSNTTYKSVKMQLEVGESVLFYTDGILEAVSPEGEEYSERRLKKLVENNRSLSPEELSNIINDDLQKFEHGNRFDDITTLVLKRVN